MTELVYEDECSEDYSVLKRLVINYTLVFIVGILIGLFLFPRVVPFSQLEQETEIYEIYEFIIYIRYVKADLDLNDTMFQLTYFRHSDEFLGFLQFEIDFDFNITSLDVFGNITSVDVFGHFKGGNLLAATWTIFWLHYHCDFEECFYHIELEACFNEVAMEMISFAEFQTLPQIILYFEEESS